MALITIPFTYTVGAVIVASQLNSCNSVIYSDFNGNITTANLSASAGIVDTQLAQITTASKVSGAALVTLNLVPSGAGLIPPKNVFPAGMIVLWSGSIASIPSGWVICDGTNSTPDLRNNFVVGAGSTYAVAATGGTTTHNHTGVTGVQQNITAGTGFAVGAADKDHKHSISTDNNLPPYYALAYIMKT